jgi:hypothetical protein
MVRQQNRTHINGCSLTIHPFSHQHGVALTKFAISFVKKWVIKRELNFQFDSFFFVQHTLLPLICYLKALLSFKNMPYPLMSLSYFALERHLPHHRASNLKHIVFLENKSSNFFPFFFPGQADHT